MYDKKDVIEKKLNPLIQQLYDLAEAEGVQFLLVAQVKWEETDTDVLQLFTLTQNVVDGIRSPQFAMVSGIFQKPGMAEDVVEGLRLLRGFKDFQQKVGLATTEAAGSA